MDIFGCLSSMKNIRCDVLSYVDHSIVDSAIQKMRRSFYECLTVSQGGRRLERIYTLTVRKHPSSLAGERLIVK